MRPVIAHGGVIDRLGADRTRVMQQLPPPADLLRRMAAFELCPYFGPLRRRFTRRIGDTGRAGSVATALGVVRAVVTGFVVATPNLGIQGRAMTANFSGYVVHAPSRHQTGVNEVTLV